jgi:hypothetical protein
MRQSILDGSFPAFVNSFLATMFPKGDVPPWVVEALGVAGVEVAHVAEVGDGKDGQQNGGVVAEGKGGKGKGKGRKRGRTEQEEEAAA